MAEAQTYVFDYKEVAEALVKKQGIHEGLWGIYMEFGIGGGNIPGPSGNMVVPAAIVPVLRIGLHRYDKPTALTVDAAEINPLMTKSQESSSVIQKRSSRKRKEKV